METGNAELVDARRILPGEWQLTFHAGHLATGARAGQHVHLDPRDTGGVVRRPLPINTADATTGTITLVLGGGTRGPDALTRLRAGDRLDVHGPLGRPFEVDPRSHHLLLVAEGRAMSRLRMLVDEALATGRQVTLLLGAESARDVYPSSLLPDEVEYVVATRDGSVGHRGAVTDLVPGYEAWADQAFGAGPWSTLAALARLAATRRTRLGVAKLGRKRGGGRADPVGSPLARRKAFLQVALDQTIGCATAVCLGCAVIGTNGAPLRVCRDGPVFAADELDWDLL